MFTQVSFITLFTVVFYGLSKRSILDEEFLLQRVLEQMCSAVVLAALLGPL